MARRINSSVCSVDSVDLELWYASTLFSSLTNEANKPKSNGFDQNKEKATCRITICLCFICNLKDHLGGVVTRMAVIAKARGFESGDDLNQKGTDGLGRPNYLFLIGENT